MLFVKGTEVLIFTPLHLKFYFDYTQLLNCIYFHHPWQLVCCCFYFYLDIYIWINIHTHIYIYIYIYIYPNIVICNQIDLHCSAFLCTVTLLLFIGD